ncbi:MULTISPECIES: photosystem II cytochrome c-550 [Arthrospira]|jgi:photosystem II cytochrome c550|uniref:Photosystem II extrinsic protein V n=1 Tax=Limnospira platensis NIES-46 TaxID=1236695 RepID=A0A5M3TAB0_LIMPL|nr:photosystem II cytochrome c-550 [Arthrospira platensis]AMW29348.1 cytochrome c-550 [Arthrospira platensis YZ]KDR58438.1 cytochrome c-550 [Arthrospira platensis str. Paraca]MBD2671690.1 cytochrome c-550 [Arthrospira platensis FACHB-439]MBD2712676.1 cytochrome c-550 [Arthrospira platensis FACHB-835]MDF2213278.1 photosystem II cytochrome c-550 [Arthrospira platensis NCB002]MDT9185273.1 photosystem II cytochrome c-550 [Limnospira sp. PMC 289.06]MDT9297537.1 photosystem II cytochrome c-550 [Ar
MLKRYIWLAVATVFFTFQMWVGNANALELTEELRTFPINAQGDTAVLSLKEIKKGQQVFNAACAQCHALGVTKTNPDVNLSPEALALATPPRDNIAALVDYIKNPTTYDGFVEISELHPSLKSSDIFPKMRNISEDDLYNVAGYILLQPKVRGEQWGGGKYLR